jgi:S1-C subfamily serine protease
MKSKIGFLVAMLFLLYFDGFSQSLNQDRVAKIKACTVKIIIEGNGSIGTGFFVNPNGTLLTCWHVIEPALIRDINTNAITGFRKIFIVLNNNEKLQVDMPIKLITQAYNSALAYDYCVLFPILAHSPFQFLKLGNFDNLHEGQEVYTCGYPLGIEQQFITKGIVSTKYIDTNNSITNAGSVTKFPRSQALLDLTLNKGNSGGAVIAIGQSIDDDVVIGIADFIINPIGGNAEALATMLKGRSGGVFISGVDPNALFSNIIEVLNNTSIGVSGCVSINHALQGFALISH